MKQEFLLPMGAMILTVILGIFFVVSPADTLVTILRILGVFLVVFSAMECISYFAGEERTFGMKLRMVEAVALVIFGIVLIVNPCIFVELYPVYMGIILILFGWSAMLRIWDMKKLGSERWLAHMGLAFLAVLMGGLVLCNPFGTIELLVRIAGGILIYNGILGIRLLFGQRKLTKQAALEKVSG